MLKFMPKFASQFVVTEDLQYVPYRLNGYYFCLGAQMKNVNLEGSHMAGVNLRVATLKNGNLQNCDLRGAVLAGADLEVRVQELMQNCGLQYTCRQ